MKWRARDIWVWHRVFAWFPIRIREHVAPEQDFMEAIVIWKWVWLETVERIAKSNGAQSWWIYR